MNTPPELDPVSKQSFQETVSGSSRIAEVVSPFEDDRWKRELSQHSEVTVFHSVAWARVLHKTYGFRPRYYILKGSGNRSVMLPLMEVRKPWGTTKAVSLPFTDSCPMLLPAGDAAPDPSALLTDARVPTNSLPTMLLRQLRGDASARRWTALELRLGLEERKEEAASVCFFNHTVTLESGDKAQLAACESSVRRCLRQSQSGPLTITVGANSEMLAEYFRLHCITRRRQGAPPQPKQFFLNIQQDLISQGLGYFVLASLDSKAIAGAVFLHQGRKAVYKFGASDLSLQQLRPNHGVMWTGIRHAARLGCTSMDLGRTSMENEGLRRFKRGWGATEVRQVYHCIDTKLNRWRSLPDRTTGWQTHLFHRLPLWVSRWIGRLVYRYAA